MADQEGIFSQVPVSIIVVRLDGLAWQLLAQELHLVHLFLGQAQGVDVVWVRVRQGLNGRYHFDRLCAGPSSNHAWVLRAVAIKVVERPGHPIAK